MSLASLMRSAEQAESTSKTAGKADGLGRVIRILNDTCSDPKRYCRIVRSQLGREERSLFTFNQIHRRAMDGDIDACAVMQEFIDQERHDGVPASVTDEHINQLWKAGISIGRILSGNEFKLANFYQGKGKEGAKPYVSLSHMAKAMMWCAENGHELEGPLYKMMVAFQEKFFPEAESMTECFEELDPTVVEVWA